MIQQLPNVRILSPVDEGEVMTMCRRLHDENGLFSFDEVKVRECLHRCFSGDGTIVGVIGDPGKIEASTCLSISDFYYSHDWHLAELWNYVLPEHRKGTRNAEALIEFGKACSEKMGIPFLTGIITNKSMAGKVRLYRRMLGAPAGAFFIHNANWKPEPMVSHHDLQRRLREFAQKCSDGGVTPRVAQRQLGPLLSEAAEAIADEDNIWGRVKTNNHASAH